MKHRIVVIGAGYAGTHAAGRLARRLHPGDTEITLVNADPDFVERVRMHQFATGQELRCRALRELCAGTGVTVRTGRVTAVDVAANTVELAEPRRPAHDRVGHPCLRPRQHRCRPWRRRRRRARLPPREQAGRALRLCERLRGLAAGATVLVVGGGLTAIEAATEIAERRPDLRVAMAARRSVGGWLSPKAQRHLRLVLDRLAITVHEDSDIVGVTATEALTALRACGSRPT